MTPSTSLPPPRVAVIILSYNSRKWLERCIQSIFDTTCPHATVIFVDNGSQGGSFEFTKSRFPSIRHIQTGESPRAKALEG